METPIKRCEELGLKLSLHQRNRYVEACKELSFFLRHAYSLSPKNLQALIFEDTLLACRLLPQLQTQNSISTANSLLQSADSALPKQKKVLVVTEFRHAMVAIKRRGKAQQEEEEVLPHLPEEVLTTIFSFLDIRSLASAAMICRLWSVAASENHLWRSMYVNFFGEPNEGLRLDKRNSHGMIEYRKVKLLKMNMVTGNNMRNWRNTFKRDYIGLSSKKFTPYRGYCRNCNLIVWLDDTRCYSRHTEKNCTNPKVLPVSMFQIVSYVLDDLCPSESYSESDSDSDDESVSRLWANIR